MSIKFNPQAAGESAKSKELPSEGVYAFKVIAAKEKTSKENNYPMVEVSLLIHNKHNSANIKDYLGAWPYGEVKILQFLDSIGLPTSTGELFCNQVVDRKGYLKLTLRESTNPRYPGKQTNVQKYLSHGDMIAEGYLKPGTPPILNPEPPPPVRPQAEPEQQSAPAFVPVADDDLVSLPF